MTSSEDVQLWFNPHCSKSRRAREILEERGISFRVIAYLEDPIDRGQLEQLLTRLGTTDPMTVIRPKEAPFAELDLASADSATLLDAIASHPTLLERPIVVRGERAVIARPPEELETLF